MPMQEKTLVVYYSRTGTTKILAQNIITYTWADSEEILDMKKRKWFRWYLRSGHDAAHKRLTTIQLPIFDPSKYDHIYIGTPVWDFGMSCAIRTYIHMYRTKFPARVSFFCTMRKDSAREVLQEMTLVAGVKPFSCISYTQKEMQSWIFKERLSALFGG